MKLQLQFGYGMMDHSRILIDAWQGGTVILSPRDLNPKQLNRLAKDINSTYGGETLLDPQFYLPYADHERLISHDFWPNSYSTDDFWTGQELRSLLKKLIELNTNLNTSAVILPGVFIEQVDEDWISRQRLIVNEANNLTDSKLFTTLALGADVLKSNNSIDEILEDVHDWDVEGVYLVCEHPKGEYLVTDPTWLANFLDLVAGLRLKKKKVLVGYCNHQMLSLSCVCTNWIASGTWMNVRSFPPYKFRTQYDEEIKQRATWYYCAQTLSEYKVQFLDIAQKQDVLSMMQPPTTLGNTHSDVLFSGIQPSTTQWTEQSAFRHYLHSLYLQVKNARMATFDETCDAHMRMLDSSEKLLKTLRNVGVTGQNRDFSEAIDINRSAISVIKKSRGPILKRKWDSLQD